MLHFFDVASLSALFCVVTQKSTATLVLKYMSVYSFLFRVCLHFHQGNLYQSLLNGKVQKKCPISKRTLPIIFFLRSYFSIYTLPNKFSGPSLPHLHHRTSTIFLILLSVVVKDAQKSGYRKLNLFPTVEWSRALYSLSLFLKRLSIFILYLLLFFSPFLSVTANQCEGNWKEHWRKDYYDATFSSHFSSKCLFLASFKVTLIQTPLTMTLPIKKTLYVCSNMREKECHQSSFYHLSCYLCIRVYLSIP